MKRNRSIWLTVLLVVTAVIAATLGTQYGSSQEKREAKTHPGVSDESELGERKTFPVVDFLTSSLSEEERKQAQKYDDGPPILSHDADIGRDLEAVIAFNWKKDLQTLPVEKSDIVVVGEVVSSKALLSAKKSSVFSRFEIRVSKVLKDSSDLELAKGQTLVAEREGGIVRYPSGHQFWYRMPGQRMPSVGSSYVLFLSNAFPMQGFHKSDHYLITAYELKNGVVTPMDNLGAENPLVQRYKGKNESVLLDDVLNAIRKQETK